MTLKRLLKTFVLPLIVAIAAVVAVWQLFVAQYALPVGLSGAALLPGDRVLVNRLAYGGPFGSGDSRERPAAGDIIAFEHPFSASGTISAGTVCMERCTALPGDTLWLDFRRRLVLPYRTATDALPFVIPGKGQSVDVTPWNASLLCDLLRRHEQNRVELRGDTALLLGGSLLRRVYVTQNYYWVDGSESRYGLVPASRLRGRVFCVSYSVDPDQPFYRALRPGRFFKPVR